ncbi:glycosyltransferase family 1 protein [candidate division TA06 bacterium]|uniref:Glycosyltransferase family 1 protein n=1 Tax=candidate division TA06 bacterium TaxID=2250710 RepID=A0A523UNN3_UNCT6|nr:MAG: glycosyltransferase family 1 protein [candidate division TA06 bacterium]
MRVGIDYKSALPIRVGIGRYTRNLVKSLAELDRENKYLLFCFLFKDYAKKLAMASFPAASNFKVMSAPIPVKVTRFWANRLNIPIEWLIGSFDVVHFPEPYPFRSKSARTIVTVHDIGFALWPEMFTKEMRALLEKQMRCVVEKVDSIIAVSRTTRSDLLEVYGFDKERIHIIEHGVEESFRPITDSGSLEALRRRYKLPEKFVLCVGTLEPRKNHVRLIQAFQLMCERHTDKYRLVVCGKKGWMYDEIFALAETSRSKETVMFTGYVPDEEMPYLYNLASVVAYPSLYEGFGLPVVEAMACGKPVLTSNRGAMADVAGDSALLVNPEDVNDMAEGLYRLISDDELRERLKLAGRKRASTFTWEKAARATLDVYDRVVRN